MESHVSQELSHYLTHILATWETIVGRDCAAHVDANTVASLQGRSPHSCVEDRDYITKIFVSGELFRTVTDQTARRFILDRLLQIKTIIPSIHTFLEDTKFLEPPSKILRVLLPFDYKGTIQEGLIRAYTLPQDGSFRVQKHENEYMSLKQLPEFGFWSAYRQLWLFALRHFPFISDVKPRKSSRGHAVDIGTKTSRECWFLLADLAMKVGFWSPEIQSLHSSNTVMFLAHIDINDL